VEQEVEQKENEKDVEQVSALFQNSAKKTRKLQA
jgi:hypothetical protein